MDEPYESAGAPGPVVKPAEQGEQHNADEIVAQEVKAAADEVAEILLDVRPFVVGLTGAFGGGCTTAAWHLAQRTVDPFAHVKLSDELREELKTRGVTKSQSRAQLQALGDELRHAEGNHVLAARALRRALQREPRPAHIALDGIRNLGEVRWLQDLLGENFALFAIYADPKTRWERVKENYKTEAAFYDDDKRDQGEDEEWGQQVGRCVDNSDVLIQNNDQIPNLIKRGETLAPKLEHYAALVTGRANEYPTPDEILMNMAFSASHGTKCLKRQVGAVIARGSEPLSSGFNENPDGLGPCVTTYGACYRDIIRQEQFELLMSEGRRCPFCGKKLVVAPGPPWFCGACKKSIEAIFFPDRAMKWCTALHAEERAIINARGADLEGATLYTTTFPCMLCAEKIIQAKISEVVFVDAYPDIHGRLLFADSGLPTRMFEGVRSRNFHRYFAGVQQAKEQEAVRKFKAARGAP